MCQTICKSKKNKFFVASDCNPQTIEVCKVRAEPMGIEVIVGNPFEVTLDNSYMGILLSYPATDGTVKDYKKVIADAKVGTLSQSRPYPLWRQLRASAEQIIMSVAETCG